MADFVLGGSGRGYRPLQWAGDAPRTEGLSVYQWSVPEKNK